MAEVVATPSPKPRKAPCCRTCGLPMLGHKKGGCSPSKSSPAPTRAKIEDLEESLGCLQLDVPDKTPSKGRRRSSVIPKQPSLESLTSSAVDTLELVLSSTKEQSDASPARSRTSTPRPSAVFQPKSENEIPTLVVQSDEKTPVRPRRSLMPGTLVNEFSLEDCVADSKPVEAKEGKLTESKIRDAEAGGSGKENSPRPTSAMKEKDGNPSPKVPTKKRKSVRVSLPGYTRSSLRLHQAQPLDVTEADGMLRATFFKTTVQQATLFKFTSRDAAILEEAASKLGLQSHYYSRSPAEATPEEDINWLIIGKNEKSVDDMLQTMESETSEASSTPEKKPTQGQVTSHFLTGVTAAGVVGAAVMWAGLAFA